MFIVMYPRGCCIKTPLLSLEFATSEKKKKKVRRSHSYAGNSASQAVLSMMQLTLHAPNISRRFELGASDVCLVGVTRRGPSRHFRDARAYGRTTTAMYDREHTTHPTPTINKTEAEGGGRIPFQVSGCRQLLCVTQSGSSTSTSTRTYRQREEPQTHKLRTQHMNEVADEKAGHRLQQGRATSLYLTHQQQ